MAKSLPTLKTKSLPTFKTEDIHIQPKFSSDKSINETMNEYRGAQLGRTIELVKEKGISGLAEGVKLSQQEDKEYKEKRERIRKTLGSVPHKPVSYEPEKKHFVGENDAEYMNQISEGVKHSEGETLGLDIGEVDAQSEVDSKCVSKGIAAVGVAKYTFAEYMAKKEGVPFETKTAIEIDSETADKTKDRIAQMETELGVLEIAKNDVDMELTH